MHEPRPGLLIHERTPSGHFNPLYDAQGDIIALVNSSGKVERTFRYGSDGENVKSEGAQSIPCPFGFKAPSALVKKLWKIVIHEKPPRALWLHEPVVFCGML